MISDGNGSYVESSSNEFPTEGYKFNTELSGCIDLNGNKIDSTLSYSDGMISLSSNKTSMCYVYFDVKSLATCEDTVGNCLLENPTSGLNTTMEGGLYRYQGTNDTVNNYICFGTSDKSTCTGNTDAYMYRIIGINSSGQLKLIKKEALNTAYYWHNSYSSDTTWPNSDLYKGLNGISGGQYSNLFIGNTTYVPSGWSDKIATVDWKYGDNTTSNTTAENLYSIENGWTTTTSAKIGLMYMHDYYYAYQSGGLNCSPDGDSATCQTAWIYLWNSGNDSGAPSEYYEWTMSRYGYYSGYYRACNVLSSGVVDYFALSSSLAVRPVYYLTSGVTYLSGTGTASDPIIIE